METARRSMTVTSDHDHDGLETRLPSYLTRHIDLGFDSDDITALISSINSSQVPTSQVTSSLPHLPAEILLRILDHVPIDHVLDWRRICRGFRDALDGRVLFDCLKRMELIGYIGPRENILRGLTVDEYEQIHLLRLCFRETRDDVQGNSAIVEDTTEGAKGPKWARKYATFDNRDGWVQRYEQCIGSKTALRTWVEESLDPDGARAGFGMLNWCISLNGAVLDVEETWKDSLVFDVSTTVMSFPWKDVLFSFLKSETMARKMMQEKRNSTFTFNLQEDCLRDARRKRLRSALDQEIKEDRNLAWALRLLRPLFGKPRYEAAAAPWDSLEISEDNAMRILVMLRREASMSTHELAYLKQLASDDWTMAKEVESINTTFLDWKKNVYGDVRQHIQVIHLEVESPVPANPLFWDDQTITTVSERVSKWRTQMKTIEQVTMLLRASSEALAVPEGAFDDLGSQLEESE